ncbi:efflux RND transporter permease subunit [Lentisalinibacter orientalis]|uniref:efflux RND transporter permease subunit n=1 Tax=Lentisalinibacter orientalis TaxID=2992241 RepID=UPI00386F54EE
MRHTEFSLRRPVTVTMIFAALAGIGLISSRLLPLEQFPDIEWPGFFINIPYEGSTPEEVERLITRPAEAALSTLSGVKRMNSTSGADGARIWMEYGFNSNAATEAVEARVKLDAIRDELPPDLKRIMVYSGSLNDEPIMTLRLSSDRDLSREYLMLDRVLKRRIERIEGVSKVDLQGVEPPEVRILLDSGRVAAHGINLYELYELLQRSNFSVSAGRLESGEQRWTLRSDGELRNLAEIGDLIIDGGNLRLADIADIRLVPEERDYGRHLDGREAVGLGVTRASGANMVEVADRVNEELEKIAELPSMRGIRIFNIDNKADSVRSSLADLLQAGLIGSLLAVLVLYLFLRQVTTTLIVMLAVPVSLVITLGVMYFSGLTLNILTLMGLMLAVGMLVDNSVVITESIFRYRQEYPDDPRRATLEGVDEVGLAVIASTATSVCVFLPIVFGEQIDITVFLWHVGVTISVAIVLSLLVSQTLIPLLASRVPAPPPPQAGSAMAALTDRYSRALAWTLRHPRWSALAAVIVLASPAAPIGLGMLQTDMFPQEPSRRLELIYHIDDIYPVERVEMAVNRMEAFLFENAERLDIESVYSYYDTGRAQSSILLTEGDAITMDAQTVMDTILEEMPELVIGRPDFQWQQQGGGPGFGITLTGESTERLAELAGEAWRVLSTVEGLEGLTSDLTAGPKEVQVVVDRERAARIGLTSQTVGQAVAVAMRGQPLREFRTPDGEIGVRLAFREDDRQTMEQLANLTIMTPSGERVLLGAVADLHERTGPRQIRRTDRKTSVKISGSIDTDSSLSEIRPVVQQLMDQIDYPPGYGWSFGEGVDRSDETQQLLMQNILLGVALIFIVMAALFESVLYPVSIMVSLIYSITGVIWFLALTGTTMSFMAMIGIMILIGIVVNNGIVLVDHINNLRRAGMPREQAVLEGARDRLRPILMTVATTILGLLPLAISTTKIGGDGPSYFPMARAIIGGLAFSTVTSLLLVPLVYVSLDRARNWVGRVRRYARAGASAAA